jgi:serine-type D-Ala-D-Ala carboxypeptidase (penicillin-binding protein 5/6)
VSNSPFLPQSRSSRRARAVARHRRRRRRLRALAVCMLALVAVGVAISLGLARSGAAHNSASQSGRSATVGSRGPSTGTSTHSQITLQAAPLRSPTGLPLGRAPLALDLSGSDDPVQIAFHNPPRAGLLFDLTSGRVLWQLNPLKRLHMASLTKMMTALRVVRSTTPSSPVPITKEAVEAAGSKVGVLPLGKDVPVETMLYGLLLPSGNDAAVALAQHVSGSVGAFVDSMNAEAARLGLGCTHYTSPSGYFNAHNYTCAADLAELAHIDLQQPRIAHIVHTAAAALPFPIKGGKLYLYNNNPLLVYDYPGATGMKTGYTELAGDCLVGTAERDGVRLGVVLLHSPELGRQAEYLLNRGFEDVYGQAPIPEPPIPPGR